MNNPEHAIEFLDTFIGLFKTANADIWWEDPTSPKTLMLPLIHVYGITDEKERIN